VSKFSRSLKTHKKSRFQANREILAVIYSEKYEDFVRLIKFFGVIAELQRAKRASEAPWVRKIGNPSS